MINTTSVTAYKGSAHLLDYAFTKGAIISFTRPLQALAEKNIRVNRSRLVRSGSRSFPLHSLRKRWIFRFRCPLRMGGATGKCEPRYLYTLKSTTKNITGQVMHPNGGTC